MRCAFVTMASPEQVLRAYTDFSERRLQIWRDTLTPANYRLVERGDTWAVVREGSLRMGVVLRYDWAEPGGLRWSIVESTFCDRGEGRLQVTAAPGGGSRVVITIEEHGGHGLRGRAVLLLKGLLGPLVLPRTSRPQLDRFAREHG